jgi:hypothetical protein
MKIRARFLGGLLLFLFVGYVFYSSPLHYLSDSTYSLLMDEAILEHGTPNMMPYQVPRGHGIPFINQGYLWTLDPVMGRILYVYPWGTPLLSLPEVAVFEAAGFRVAPQGIYNADNELKIQVYLTTFLCALVVWLFFDMAASMLPLGWSITIALSAAFGTQIWSTVSKSLWPQTWYLLLISAAVWLLVKERAWPIVLATLLAWASFTRPQGVVIAVMVGAYLLIEYGWWFLVEYATVGTVWAVVFAGVTLFFFGRVSPPAYQGGLDFPHEFTARLKGIMISPSRGLLVFVPVFLLPVYLTIRYWRVLRSRPLALLAIAAIGVHIVLVASWPCWWGGGSYGPRLLIETIPWFVLLATFGVKAFIEDQQLTIPEGSAVILAAFVLLTISVAMNTVGATSYSGLAWNKELGDCSLNPQRIWDWQHPQWLAWAQSR